MGLKSVLRMTTAVVMLSFASMAPSYADTPPDTLVMATSIDGVTSFDPAEVFEFVGGEISNNVYLRLLVRNEADFSEVIGGAAESWEISEDGLTYTFTMRDGLTFASGAPVTAQDAAFSLQRVVKLGKSPAFILTQFGWTPENVEQNVTAQDDRTLVLRISEAFAPTLVLNALSSGVGSMVERTAISDMTGSARIRPARAHSCCGHGSQTRRSFWRPTNPSISGSRSSTASSTAMCRKPPPSA
jgi:peptide/nickel transport system substrate-binding protein